MCCVLWKYGRNIDLEDDRFCFIKGKVKFKSITDLSQKVKPYQHSGGKPEKETQRLPLNVRSVPPLDVLIRLILQAKGLCL